MDLRIVKSIRGVNHVDNNELVTTTGRSVDAVAAQAVEARAKLEAHWGRVKSRLKAKIGEELFSSWFSTIQLDRLEDGIVHLSQPTKFLKNWIDTHYTAALLQCCKAEFPDAESVDVSVRQPAMRRASLEDAGSGMVADAESGRGRSGVVPAASRPAIGALAGTGSSGEGGGLEVSAAGFQGSPLERRYTFETFVVGTSNRLAHAAAKQIAETCLETPRFNPLYIHSTVGLGKTHLLHAIAWEVRRRQPNAQVLYLTAERFRYRFVEAIRSQDAHSFKERLRGIDILIIDDMEFLQGARTEQEFDHTLNALLDGGKQVIVASARAPMQLESLDARMRSRLVGGLVTEISPLDPDLRLKILERRVAERRSADPSFNVEPAVLQLLSERLTESGRELDGAITRLYAACHLAGTPISLESVEKIISDLVTGFEPKRIKIEDILRVVSKHFGVSRGDILSQRRQRSIVHPRQIGMYLAKTLTARSLPEIGRRFGNRDHTTVLHAIRKIEQELKGDTRLRAEIEDLKRLLHN